MLLPTLKQCSLPAVQREESGQALAALDPTSAQVMTFIQVAAFTATWRQIETKRQYAHGAK